MRSAFNHIMERYGLFLFSALLFLFSPVSAESIIDECRISYDRLALLKQGKQNHTLIDIRPPAEYRKLHVPGSVNIPAYQLPSKAYLKNKHIVLLDKGPESAQTYKKCTELRASGFKNIRVMEGGIYAWARQTGSAVPSLRSMDIYHVTPEDIMSNAGYRDYVVLNLSKPSPDKLLNQYVKNVISVTTGNELDIAFEKVSGKKIILSIEAGGKASAYEKYVKNQGRYVVVILRGGISGFDRFYAKHKAMLEKDKFTLQGLQSCTN